MVGDGDGGGGDGDGDGDTRAAMSVVSSSTASVISNSTTTTVSRISGASYSTGSAAAAAASVDPRLGISLRGAPRHVDFRGPTPPPLWQNTPVVPSGVLQVTTPASRPRLFGRLRSVREAVPF